MTKLEKFFSGVWRVNALLLVLLLAAALFGMGSLLFGELGTSRRARSTQGSDALTVESEEGLRLGAFEPVPGTDVLRANLSSPGRAVTFKSGRVSDTRNILFIDRAAACTFSSSATDGWSM